jgi:hypothetical protein
VVEDLACDLGPNEGMPQSFHPFDEAPMASMRSSTLVKRLPRRMAWPVMIPKKISIMFSPDPEVE